MSQNGAAHMPDRTYPLFDISLIRFLIQFQYIHRPRRLALQTDEYDYLGGHLGAAAPQPAPEIQTGTRVAEIDLYS